MVVGDDLGHALAVGLVGGTVGLACMGLAPSGLMFTLALLPNALWGLSMPTLQSLMTQRVSEKEQGQLQGASNSVASLAGIFSPLFFVWLGASLDLRAVGAHPELVGLGLALGAAAAVVHGLMALTGQPLSLAITTGAQLGVPVAAATLGRAEGVLAKDGKVSLREYRFVERNP